MIKGGWAAEEGGQREVKVSVDMIARGDTPYRYHSNRWSCAISATLGHRDGSGWVCVTPQVPPGPDAGVIELQGGSVLSNTCPLRRGIRCVPVLRSSL